MAAALRRALPLWLVLVAAYVAALAVGAGPVGEISAPEARSGKQGSSKNQNDDPHQLR